MPPRDWFGLAIRIGALVFLVFALYDLFFVFAKLLNLETRSKQPLSTDVAATVFYVILAATGLLGADHLVNLSYGSVKRD